MGKYSSYRYDEPTWLESPVMDRFHVIEAERLAVRVHNVLGERRGDWVRLVAYVYRDQSLPPAVAASMARLARLSSVRRK